MRIHADFVKAFMEYSSFSQSPERYLYWSALSVVAGALERKVWLANGATTFYPNLYVMLIGDPASRKSTAANLAVELLREVPGISFMAARVNEASFMRSLTMAGERKSFEYQGEKYKHSAVYLYSSEASTSFAPMYQGGGIVIPLTDIFHCEPFGWSKLHGWEKITMKDGLISVFNPCVNMLACSTPTWFTDNVMTKADAEGGFGSRVLLVVQKEHATRAYGWNETSAKNHKLKMELVADLRHINLLQGPYTVDQTWHVAYEHLDRTLHEYLKKEIFSALTGSYYARKLSHATKLAMILAAARKDEMILTGDLLYEAWDLVGTLEQDMTQAYSAIGTKGASDELSQQIIRYFLSNDKVKFTKANLITRFRARYPIKEILSALDLLIRTDQVKYVLVGEGLKEPTFEISSSNVLNRQDV